jgi:ParB family chromosome partitioning protein
LAEYYSRRNEMKEIGFQERRLGDTLLKVKQIEADLYDIFPNPEQPRTGPKDDPSLRKEIEENKGLFEPLLVEPHPDGDGKFLIVDGERRWSNCKVLVEIEKKEQFRKLPVLVTDRKLSKEERLRIWVYIHRQRKEWSRREKEGVARRLVELTNRVTAARILGATVRDVDKMVETYDLSERMTSMREPEASITYAREIMSLAAKYRTEEVIDTIVKKANEGLITSSKEIRDLRRVLRDDKARAEFLKERTTVKDTLSILPQANITSSTYGQGLAKDIDGFIQNLRRYSILDWADVRGNSAIITKLEECEKVLKKLEAAVK